MARIRSIKPEFFKHEALHDLEAECGLPLRLAFAGLWTQADREGRFAWRPRRLKTDILPYDDVDFAKILDALERGGFVQRFDFEGQMYGFIPSWHQHQQVNKREQESRIPDPGQCVRTTKQVHAHDKSSGEGELEGEREQDSDAYASADADELKDRLFGTTTNWLAKQSAVSVRTAKSFIGLCIRDHGEQDTLNAAVAAHKAQAPDPRAYMRAVLDKGGGANGKDFSMSAVWKELDDEYRNESAGEPDHLETDDDAVRETPPH